MKHTKKGTSRAAMMTAALTLVGSAGIAADVYAQQERRGATTQPTAPAAIDAVDEGSGEEREAVEGATEAQEAEPFDPLDCRPGSCPMPLYGVTPLEEL